MCCWALDWSRKSPISRIEAQVQRRGDLFPSAGLLWLLGADISLSDGAPEQPSGEVSEDVTAQSRGLFGRINGHDIAIRALPLI